jgi:hypothetical protein
MSWINLRLVPRCSLQLASMLLLAAVAGGCGGPAQAEPTAIPASVVRPVQPTPQYPGGSDVFSLLTPSAAPQFVATAVADAPLAIAGASDNSQRAAIKLFIENQTPSAMGISPGGTAIYAARGGQVLAGVPAGGIVTVTGKSADGAWYSVYNDAAVFGWTPAGQLRVYGGDDLMVVEQAPDPAPVATLLAQAAVPVRVLDELMAQLEATPAPNLAAPLPASPQGEAAATPVTGVVTSEGRLNLRAEPDTAAAIVRKLEAGTSVNVVGRNADATWLRLELADGVTGWAAAEFVTVDR